jgi:hypothetical protein
MTAAFRINSSRSADCSTASSSDSVVFAPAVAAGLGHAAAFRVRVVFAVAGAVAFLTAVFFAEAVLPAPGRKPEAPVGLTRLVVRLVVRSGVNSCGICAVVRSKRWQSRW